MDTELDPEQVRDGLEAAGLTTYQADAYVTLLERGTAPAVDVAKNCSVPVPRIYDVLKDLEQAGYIETFEQDTLHARARDPVDVIDDLHSRSELLSDTASAVEDAWEASSLAEHKMNVFKYADTVLDQAEELVRGAETTVELGVTREQLAELESALETATGHGALTRVSLYVGEDETVDPAELPDAVSEVRVRRIPGPFVAIVDRTHTCFAPDDRTDKPYGVVLNDYLLSFIFHWYFQTCLWSIWGVVQESAGGPVDYVSLEQFIRDVYPFWRTGATVTATVSGVDTDTGEPREVSGIVSDLVFTNMDLASPDLPTYGQLAGQSTLWLEVDDETLVVGGWGAVFEDVEAQRITLDGVVVEGARASAAAEVFVDHDVRGTLDRLAPVVSTSI